MVAHLNSIGQNLQTAREWLGIDEYNVGMVHPEERKASDSDDG